MTDLSLLKTPGPTETALTAPFWRAAERGELLIQRCEACAKAAFYPRAHCPHCWSDLLKWEPSAGKGALRSFSEIHKPGHPGWLPATPYVVGLVALDEGPTMTGFILRAVRPPKIGDRVEMQPTNIGGRILPAFQILAREGAFK